MSSTARPHLPVMDGERRGPPAVIKGCWVGAREGRRERGEEKRGAVIGVYSKVRSPLDNSGEVETTIPSPAHTLFCGPLPSLVLLLLGVAMWLEKRQKGEQVKTARVKERHQQLLVAPTPKNAVRASLRVPTGPSPPPRLQA
ncbi:hypothetical protein E2320_007916 [Naja naja]|nr:hypothetical protein E2320_007916 [Naja naja]